MSALQSELAGTAWISKRALSVISREADRAAPKETGGILLGYWAEAATVPVVIEAVGPGPKAIHELDRFVPDHEFHELEVARLYTQSEASLLYLGDWHSHPGVAAYLSTKDVATLRRIAEFRQARAPRPLMLILGFGPNWEPVLWSIRKRVRCFCATYMPERWDISSF